ncbi:DUF4376 domain-containing protein [Bacteroides sp. OttesenSCG-928-F21]|nr:DUF4376 domain-containing protein [Bacteroides sp. OttesenSCG-928-F21]
MKKRSDIYYIAEDGMGFMRVSDGDYCGEELYLGLIYRDMSGNVLPEPVMDVIENYIEVDIPEEFLDGYVPVEPEPEVPEPEPEEPEIPVEDIDLADAKIKKLKALVAYDSSPAVNQFYAQGYPLWFKEERRTSLHLTILADKAAGKESITFVEGSFELTLPLDVAEHIILTIHSYASNCYVVTQKHKASIEALDTIEEVLEYDFTTGYPDKINI